MARPIWKGNITFGLVNIPIVLYSAEKTSKIALHLLDRKTHSRIHYVRQNEQGKEVPWADVVKGYEYEKDQFVELEESEIKAFMPENFRDINIENFVSRENINFMYLDKPYYLVPDKNGNKGYVILREVLNATHKIGVAQIVIHTRQYLAILLTYKNALVLNIMRYYNEIRKPEEFELPSDSLSQYKISAKEMAVAKQLVASMSESWKHQKYKDEFSAALEKLIEQKIAHKPTPKVGKATPRYRGKNVVDFVSLMKKSLAQRKPGKISRGSHKKVTHARAKRV